MLIADVARDDSVKDGIDERSLMLLKGQTARETSIKSWWWKVSDYQHRQIALTLSWHSTYYFRNGKRYTVVISQSLILVSFFTPTPSSHEHEKLTWHEGRSDSKWSNLSHNGDQHLVVLSSRRRQFSCLISFQGQMMPPHRSSQTMSRSNGDLFSPSIERTSSPWTHIVVCFRTVYCMSFKENFLVRRTSSPDPKTLVTLPHRQVGMRFTIRTSSTTSTSMTFSMSQSFGFTCFGTRKKERLLGSDIPKHRW